MRLNSICADCGASYTRDRPSSRCPECAPKDDTLRPSRAGKTTTQRGYGGAWQRLSKRARAMQPFCSDCGTPEDLTADHSEETWRRMAAGKVLRLQDVDVVCRRCNSERGAARGESSTDQWRGPKGLAATLNEPDYGS